MSLMDFVVQVVQAVQIVQAVKEYGNRYRDDNLNSLNGLNGLNRRSRSAVTATQSVLQCVSDKIQRKNRDHERQSGIGGQMRRDQQKLSAIVQHRSPRWRRRLDAQAEKAQAALGDDRCCQAECRLNQQRWQQIGKQMA